MRNLSKPLNFVKAMDKTLHPVNQAIKKQKVETTHVTTLHTVLITKKRNRQVTLVFAGLLVAIFGFWQVTSQTLLQESEWETNVSGKVMMQVAETGKNVMAELAQWLIHYAL